MSVLHACYLVCIKPYVNGNVRVFEIGSGRGAWTKCFIAHNAAEVLCVDAVPAERNGFWDYVGCHEGLRYLVTEGFSLEEVADEHDERRRVPAPKRPRSWRRRMQPREACNGL